ncbi:MAG: hypothetical protein ACP5M1_12750 [Acidiphilium sp.]
MLHVVGDLALAGALIGGGVQLASKPATG